MLWDERQVVLSWCHPNSIPAGAEILSPVGAAGNRSRLRPCSAAVFPSAFRNGFPADDPSLCPEG